RLLRGDAGRLRQVLMNLVGNALKFTPSGTVTLAIDGATSGDRAELTCSVIDTGIGIPADAQAKLFQEFIQVDSGNARRFGGTGLGLAISSKLIKLMHGDIGVDSREGGGSRFWFRVTLPVLPAGTLMPDDEVGAGHIRALAAGVRVLLVEDEPINRTIGMHMLTRLGCEVEVARDGQEAIAKTIAGNYQLVFMDCQMPVTDGYAAAREIRTRMPGVPLPIIALTASAIIGDRERCLAAGMDDYLTKPYRPEDLQVVLARWLTSSVPARSRLVRALRSEHDAILESLSQVRSLGVGSVAGRQALIAARAALLAHLGKENALLYPTLRADAARDAGLAGLLERFAQDLEAVAESAERYFTRATHDGADGEGDLRDLMQALGGRIQREERILYREYDQRHPDSESPEPPA
nr:response regulator [Planctomycetota bacterium]